MRADLSFFDTFTTTPLQSYNTPLCTWYTHRPVFIAKRNTTLPITSPNFPNLTRLCAPHNHSVYNLKNLLKTHADESHNLIRCQPEHFPAQATMLQYSKSKLSPSKATQDISWGNLLFPKCVRLVDILAARCSCKHTVMRQ